MNTIPESRERLWSAPFVLCFAANLLQGLAFNLFLHFPGFLAQLGADKIQIGAISALTAVAAIALRPPIGRAMDQRGRRGVILLGGVLNVAVVGLYLFVDRIGPLLLFVRVLHGLAEAMLFSSLFTYAADYVPAERRTQGLALFGISGMLPMSLAGVLGDVLVAGGRYDRLFLASLGFGLASLLLSLPLRDRARDEPGEPVTLGIRAALRQPDLAPMWWIGTIFSLVLSAFFVFIERFTSETGLGSVGSFFSAYTAAALFLRVFFGWLPDRVGPLRVLVPVLLCLALGCEWLARATTAGDVAIAGVLCGVGHGFAFPILFGLVVTRSPDANRGAAMAVFTALFDLGLLIGGPAFGAVIEAGGFAWMYRLAAVAMAFGTLSFLFWDARVHRRLSAVLIVTVLGCAVGTPLRAPLEERYPDAMAVPGQRLDALHPYLWVADGRVVSLVCHWGRGAEPGVHVVGAREGEERGFVEPAIAALSRSARVPLPRVDFERADIVVRLTDGEITLPGGFGTGRALASCALELEAGRPGAARLAESEIVIDRLARRDAIGRVSALTEDVLAGTIAHELGHALGFQGHAFSGSLMVREREAIQRQGKRILRGEGVSDSTLRALYRIPSGAILRNVEVGAYRTAIADALHDRARAEGFAGPFLQVGDERARMLWRDVEGVEYGVQVMNLEETLREPDRVLVFPEPLTRELLAGE